MIKALKTLNNVDLYVQAIEEKNIPDMQSKIEINDSV
jgi:hypothetical protein